MGLYPTLAQQSKGLPPMLTGGLPYRGHTLIFNRDPVRFLQAGRARFGDVYSFRLAGSRVTVLLGPQASEAFFRASDSQLSAREAYQFTVPVFGKGISYDTSPERMNEQLSFLFPALHKQRLQRYAQVMAEEAEAYFEAHR
jgi:sterol 14-demethylase